MPFSEHIDAQEGKIRDLSVMYGAAGIFGDQALQMCNLHRDHALWRQEPLHAREIIAEVGHLRQHVIGNDEVGTPVVGHQFVGQCRAESCNQCGQFGRARSDHGGGADGEYRYSKWLEVLQQEAVVAGELHHKAFGSKAQALLNHMAVTASVLYPACGVGMGCVFVQDPTYTFDVPELHQKAPVANDRVQRIE
jgi:hypothetical protein